MRHRLFGRDARISILELEMSEASLKKARSGFECRAVADTACGTDESDAALLPIVYPGPWYVPSRLSPKM